VAFGTPIATPYLISTLAMCGSPIDHASTVAAPPCPGGAILTCSGGVRGGEANVVKNILEGKTD